MEVALENGLLMVEESLRSAMAIATRYETTPCFLSRNGDCMYRGWYICVEGG